MIFLKYSLLDGFVNFLIFDFLGISQAVYECHFLQTILLEKHFTLHSAVILFFMF